MVEVGLQRWLLSYFRWLLLTAAALIIISCKRSESDTLLLIHISGVNLTPPQDIRLPKHHNITTIWVYADDKFWGTFFLPAVVPVSCRIGSSLTISYRAGVRRNGLENDQVIYPFYRGGRFSIQCTGNSAEVIDTTLVVEYVDTSFISVLWYENGEDGVADISQEGTGLVEISTQEKISGSGSLKVCPAFSLRLKSDSFTIPLGSTKMYLELSYLAPDTFSVGFLYYDELSGSFKTYWIVRVFPSNGIWKKLYVDLSPAFKVVDQTEYMMILLEVYDYESSGKCFYFDDMAVLSAR